MDVVEHEGDEHSDNDSYDRSGDIGLVKKQNDSEHKQDDSHQSACESVKSISDIYRIDDRDSSEEGKYRIKDSKWYFACNRPKIDIVDP